MKEALLIIDVQNDYFPGAPMSWSAPLRRKKGFRS